MQFVIVLLIAAAVFGVCYLVDKGFTKAFRGKAQHRSGMAVRANKRFGVFGVVLTVLGVMAFCIGIGDGPVLIVGGLIVLAMGVFLAVYYLSFGIFYDGESFLMSRFGKKDAEHRYEEIVGQKLYVVQGGSVVAELYLKDGSTVAVSIGGAPEDPQFTIDDLLPHLGVEQSKKPLGEAIPGESLNLLIGSRPFKDDEGSDRVKLAVMDYLNQKYHIVEEHFISAELEVVPAFKAADIGFDRSLIGAYGHDDRVCGFACLAALLALGTPGKTAVCMLADKEEIGSAGVSGMKSAAFDTFVSDLCDAQRVPLKACYEKSFCLSADVTAAYDPNFAEVYEKRNSARVNYGIGLCKYTGSRGKSGASDASAEVVAYIRRVLDEAGVVWQMAELGKVDAGGGGTVACYMAERDIDTIDAGVPVLSMHAPFETVGKLDCYMTYKGIKAFYEK